MSISKAFMQLSPFRRRLDEARPASQPLNRPQPQSLEGYIDGVAGGAIAGWAIDRATPGEPVNVEIYVDHALWAFLRANEPRPDLASAFQTSGHHGFQWELPLHLADGAPHTISIRHTPFGTEIPGSPLTVDTSHIRSSPLRVSSVETQKMRQRAVPYMDAPPRALRTAMLAPGESYEFNPPVFEMVGDAISERRLPLKWTEPDAVSLSIPDARIYRWDVIAMGPGQVLDCSWQSSEMRGCPLFRADAEGNSYLDRRLLHDAVRIPNEIVHIFRPGAYNHYHWLIEILPQLWAMQNSAFADKPILINELSFKTGRPEWEADRAVKLATLELLGLGAERQFRVSTSVMDVDVAHVPLSLSPPVLKHAAGIHSDLKNAVLRAGPHAGNSDMRRIFVSRAHASRRRLVNEDALFEILCPRGFQRVVLERLPFAEQVALFSQAEQVVAPHGAGLANIVFMAPGTQVIELLPQKLEDRAFIFSRLSHLYGLRHAIVLTHEAPGNVADPDHMADPRSLMAAFEALG